MAALCIGNAEARCVNTVRWSDDAPCSFKLPIGEISGFNSELIRAALTGLNCEARFVELLWARALRELEQGRLDILPGGLLTPEREKFAYFSRPVKSAAATQRLRALTGIQETVFRLGAQIGVAYGADYDAPVNTPVFA